MIEDEDHGTPANKASRDPSRAPATPPVLDLTAASPTPVTAEPSDVATPEPFASLSEDSSAPASAFAPEHEAQPFGSGGAASEPRDDGLKAERAGSPRSNALTALFGIILLLLLAAMGYLFYAQQNAGDAAANAADLSRRVTTLEHRPAPTDPGAFNNRLDAVAGNLNALKQSVTALEGRVAAVEGKASAAASTPADTSGLDGKLGGLEGKTGDLGRELDQLKTSLANVPKPPDLAPVEGRLGDLDTRLAALAKTVDTLPKVDLAPLTTRLDALEGRLKPIETQVEAAAAPERVAQTRAAPLAVTAESIRGSIDAGRPFQPDVDALRRLGAEPSLIEPLQSLAANGAPTLTDLRADLAGLRDKILADSAPAPSGSYLDRLVGGARNLVRVRPLGTVVGDMPAAVLTRIDDNIARDDLSAALNEWQKLPDAAKEASKGLADRLRLRLNAETAARTIGSNAIQAMAATRQ